MVVEVVVGQFDDFVWYWDVLLVLFFVDYVQLLEFIVLDEVVVLCVQQFVCVQFGGFVELEQLGYVWCVGSCFGLSGVDGYLVDEGCLCCWCECLGCWVVDVIV